MDQADFIVVGGGSADMTDAMLNVPVTNFICPEHLQPELAAFRSEPLVAAMSCTLFGKVSKPAPRKMFLQPPATAARLFSA